VIPIPLPVMRRYSLWGGAAMGGGLVMLLLGIGWKYHAGPGAYVVHAVEHWQEEAGLRRVAGHRERLVRYAAEAGVDPYLLAGVMWSESRGVSGQTSSAGALGLMQLSMAAASDAAKRLGFATPTEEQLLHDQDLNVRLAANHLAWLLEHRGEWTLEAVLVSYNAGRAKLKRWIRAAGGYEEWCETEFQAKREGRRTTGALAYARKTLEVAERLRLGQALEEPAAPQDPSAADRAPKTP
jgi:soluble lytic murein transglycosylase